MGKRQYRIVTAAWVLVGLLGCARTHPAPSIVQQDLGLLTDKALGVCLHISPKPLELRTWAPGLVMRIPAYRLEPTGLVVQVLPCTF